MINLTYMNFPKVPQMLRKGVTVALGSDGGSYRSVDLFSEMLVALVGHIAYFGTPCYDFPTLAQGQVLKMATISGARALLWDDEIGSIEEGKKADAVIIDADKPHLTPCHDPVSLLVLFSGGSDVDTVIVDGRPIM